MGTQLPPLTLADLPPPDTKRWVVSRKTLVVRAVQEGVISLEDALARYNMSLREFRIWETGYNQEIPDLRVTKYQERPRKDRR